MKGVSLLAVSFFMASLIVVSVSAQDYPIDTDQNTERLSLAVSPGIKEVILERGVPQTIQVNVTNITDVPLPVRASTSKFTPTENVAEKDLYTFDASSWFTVEGADFILQPNETKTVPVTITPVKDAEAGGHYATIYFQPLIETKARAEQNTAQLGTRLGILMLLVVKGNIHEQASIVDFKSLGGYMQESGPVEFELTLGNEGNIHFFPGGYVEIYDSTEKLIERVPLPISLMLPHTEKTLKIQWDNKQRIGKFSAKAFVSYGTKRVSVSSKDVRFWVVPWIKGAVLVVLMTGGVFFVIKTYWRWGSAIKALRGKHPDSK